MPDEELSMVDGDETAPEAVRLKPVTWVLVALVLLGLGSFVVGRDSTAASYSTGAFDDSGFNPVVSRPLPTDGLSLGLGENLLLGVTCPTIAGPPGYVSMSFKLVNWGQSTVVITGLAVSGSTHGLGAAEATGGGSCDQPGRDPVGGALAPGDAKLYTFWFKAPTGCPGTSRTVGLGVKAESLTGTTTKVVARDLGRLYPTTCPAPALAAAS